MDVDEDQTDPPPVRGGGQDPTGTTTQPSSSSRGAPSQAYPGHISSSDQVTRQTSNPVADLFVSSQLALSSTRNSNAPSASASTAASGLSNRRPSTTSNDSMDHTGYGPAASSPSISGGLHTSNSPMRPMSSATSSEAPVKYTPITGRVSRARKGVPVHICETCRPPKVRDFHEIMPLVQERYGTNVARPLQEQSISGKQSKAPGLRL